MAGESIEKQRRLSMAPFVILWSAGLILFIAAMVMDTNTHQRKVIAACLRIAWLVLWPCGLFFQVRHWRRVRKWRETGKWS
jgi:hypothetical protein